MFPYSCDAKLYYLPFATGALIAINVLVLAAAFAGAIDPENGWILEYGNGVHPVEWVTSMFMHAGIEHLLANMFFLWTFGLVVEGKLGWWKFLAAYFACGLGVSVIEQLIMANAVTDSPGSVGASAAIFGIMVMACIWAPANSVSVFYFLFGFRMGTFDAPVAGFAGFYVGIEGLMFAIFGTSAGSSMLHLGGGVIGAIIGVTLLKSGAVDCDDWDLFSVWKGEYGTDKKKKREAELDARLPQKLEERTAVQAKEARMKFDAFLNTNQTEQALAIRKRMIDARKPLELGRPELIKLVTGLHQSRQWAESAPIMAEILQRFPEQSEAVRIKLAQICLVELEKPGRAIELLEGLDGAVLPQPQEALRRKIEAVARQQVDEGAVELDSDTW